MDKNKNNKYENKKILVEIENFQLLNDKLKYIENVENDIKEIKERFDNIEKIKKEDIYINEYCKILIVFDILVFIFLIVLWFINQVKISVYVFIILFFIINSLCFLCFFINKLIRINKNRV